MEIILKNHDIEISIKNQNYDLSLEEYFAMFNTALIGVSWQQSQIDNFILEKSEELLEIMEQRNLINKSIKNKK